MAKIILQPIGNDKLIDDFKKHNSKRWAEKTRYKKLWKESEGAIVLFTQNREIFAKATISDIQDSGHSKYPLDYYYDDLKFINIPFSRIREIANFTGTYRNYTVLDEEASQKILDYFNLIELIIYRNDEDYQQDVDSSKVINIKDEPETPKKMKKEGTKSYFPRNKNRAKLALDRANYKCEIDNNHTTFISKSSNENYVEAHHLIPFKEQNEIDYNLDVTHNIVSLCPNCHKKIHLASLHHKKEILKILYTKHKEGLKKVHLDIGLDSLYYIYKD